MRRLRSSLAIAHLAVLGCTTQVALRATPPGIPDVFVVRAPRFDRSVLRSGLAVFSARSSDFGLVHLELVLRAGHGFDPPDKPGLARLTKAVLELHASSPQHDARFAALGATPRFGLDRQGLMIDIAVLPEDAAAATVALADLVREPVPVSEYLERARAERIDALALRRGEPDHLAALAVMRMFAPERQRVHALGYGTRASIAAMSAEDVARMLVHACNARGAAFTAVGPIEDLAPENWALAAFESWPSAEPRARLQSIDVQPAAQQIVFIPVPGMAQALVVVGGTRPRRHAAGAVAFDFAFADLQGEVQNALRAEQKFTYGIAGDIVPEPELFALPIRVRADKTGSAIAEIRRLVDENDAEPSSEALIFRRNLALAREMHVGLHASATLALAREVFLQGVSFAALSRAFESLDTVTPEQVRAAAAEYLTRARLAIVVVGDPKTVRPQLGADVLEWSVE